MENDFLDGAEKKGRHAGHGLHPDARGSPRVSMPTSKSGAIPERIF
jgi:hypothetical protein